jgi:hypothetical protein
VFERQVERDAGIAVLRAHLHDAGRDRRHPAQHLARHRAALALVKVAGLVAARLPRDPELAAHSLESVAGEDVVAGTDRRVLAETWTRPASGTAR